MLTIERPEDGVAVVTLNRPEAMNALSAALRAQLHEAFVALAGDESVRVVILTGAGRAFTAGLDLKELGADAAAMDAATSPAPEKNPVAAVERCPKPVIGAINGAAVTGGFELALACDILIASEHARFADTHARVGIMPGWGLSQKLSRLIGIHRAKELSFSGNFLDARTAADWGLVNRVVPAEELLPTALKLARDIASAPPGKVQAYKALINDGFASSFGEGLALEQTRNAEANAALSPQAIEDARAGVIARGRAQTGGAQSGP